MLISSRSASCASAKPSHPRSHTSANHQTPPHLSATAGILTNASSPVPRTFADATDEHRSENLTREIRMDDGLARGSCLFFDTSPARDRCSRLAPSSDRVLPAYAEPSVSDSRPTRTLTWRSREFAKPGRGGTSNQRGRGDSPPSMGVRQLPRSCSGAARSRRGFGPWRSVACCGVW